MGLKILGVSGSPVPNSNTDRAVKAVLEASGLESEFVKAEALVIGAYVPYGQIDGFTKAFLERLWSMRHVNNLNEGKLVVIIVNGLQLLGDSPRAQLANKMMKSRDEVVEAISREMRMENMKIVGSVKIIGNVPCLTCGEGGQCKMSGARQLFSPNAEISSKLCVAVEDQPEVWEKLNRLGKKLSKRLSK
ncbi:MAG: hypothetical protein ACTSPS_18695 [Promethearchaeota archaeon]